MKIFKARMPVILVSTGLMSTLSTSCILKRNSEPLPTSHEKPCKKLNQSHYEAMTLEARLEFYIQHAGDIPSLCEEDKQAFMAQRSLDLEQLPKTKRAAHLKRERKAREEFRTTQRAISAAEACADKPILWFDPVSDHPWNTLYRAFYVRKDAHNCLRGFDTLDPYLFAETKSFLSGPDSQRRLTLLREFLENKYEHLVADIRLRALMQRDLLAILHWTLNRNENQEENSQDRENLASALRQVIKAIALTQAQIETLPDTLYEVVPKHDFKSYMNLSAQDQTAANVHLKSFFMGSAFFVYIALPQGKDATRDYLERLQKFQPKLIQLGATKIRNPKTPQFPNGTKFLLVRRAILWSQEGKPVISPLVEGVQGRQYHQVAHTKLSPDPNQSAFSFYFSRELFYRGDRGGLKQHTKDDREFDRFLQSEDPLETETSARLVMDSCLRCHAQNDLDGNKIGSGIHTVHTYERTIASSAIPAQIISNDDTFERQQITKNIELAPSWRSLLHRDKSLQ